MLTVNKVLFYFPLETGTIFVGWLSLLFNIFVGIFILPYIVNTSLGLFFNMVIGLTFATAFVHMASCVLVIFAISHKNSNFMLPWLFGQILEIVILLIYAVYIYIIGLTHYWWHIFAIVLYVLAQVYFWICIYSMYFKLVDGRREQINKLLQEIRKRVENPEAQV